jgi:L-arabinose isomerase
MLAGGAHHTVFSQALNIECIEDLAEMTKVELLIIDEQTELRNFKATMAGNKHHFETN